MAIWKRSSTPIWCCSRPARRLARPAPTLMISIKEAAERIRAGELVAFPTETVYGLGANALDAAAVAKIFEAKERPGWDPVIVHVSDRAMLERVAVVSGALEVKVEALMAAFWPGPLTLLLPRTEA